MLEFVFTREVLGAYRTVVLFLVSVAEGDVIVETVGPREGSITKGTVVLLAFLQHAARVGRR